MVATSSSSLSLPMFTSLTTLPYLTYLSNEYLKSLKTPTALRLYFQPLSREDVMLTWMIISSNLHKRFWYNNVKICLWCFSHFQHVNLVCAVARPDGWMYISAINVIAVVFTLSPHSHGWLLLQCETTLWQRRFCECHWFCEHWFYLFLHSISHRFCNGLF